MLVTQIIEQVHSEELVVLTLDELPGISDEDFWVSEINAYAGLIFLIASEEWLLFRMDEEGYQDKLI